MLQTKRFSSRHFSKPTHAETIHVKFHFQPYLNKINKEPKQTLGTCSSLGVQI